MPRAMARLLRFMFYYLCAGPKIGNSESPIIAEQALQLAYTRIAETDEIGIKTTTYKCTKNMFNLYVIIDRLRSDDYYRHASRRQY